MNKPIPTKRAKGKPTPKMSMSKHKWKSYNKSKSNYSKEDLEVTLLKWSIRWVVIGVILIWALDLMGVEFFKDVKEQQHPKKEIKW
jgi:hypothetical protein